MTVMRFFAAGLTCLSLACSANFSFADLNGIRQISRPTLNDPNIRATSDALAQYIMGIIYDNFAETREAITHYEKAKGYREDVAEIYVKIGADLLLQGDLSQAKKLLLKAIQVDEKNSKAYLLLGVTYTSENDYEKAEEQYEEALKFDPENLKTLTFLSDLFILQGQLDEAAQTYEKILKIRKDDPQIYINLGVIYSKLNLLDKAEAKLEKAI